MGRNFKNRGKGTMAGRVHSNRGMIVLVSSSPAAGKCAALLQQELSARVQVAETPRRALALLRVGCEAVAVDEPLLDSDPTGVETLLRQAGTAVPVFINLAIHGLERLAREVRAALLRREREHVAALEAARRVLRNELKGDLTGILLSSQMALAAAPPEAQVKLRSVCDLAERMKARLEV